jgi:peroxiredoxin Q/BCP
MVAPVAILQAQADYGPPTAVLVSGPEVGRKAPDFALPWAGKDGVGPIDQWFRLSEQRGKTVVLAFYPKDFTTGCTAEMQTFTQQFADLFGENVVVVGINADSLDTHVRFAASLGVPFQLLTDQGQTVSRKFGSAGDNGYNRRTVYVISPRGEVSYRDMSFGALDPKAYSRLKKAVQTARSM